MFMFLDVHLQQNLKFIENDSCKKKLETKVPLLGRYEQFGRFRKKNKFRIDN